jgi:hypothetical protein
LRVRTELKQLSAIDRVSATIAIDRLPAKENVTHSKSFLLQLKKTLRATLKAMQSEDAHEDGERRCGLVSDGLSQGSLQLQEKQHGACSFP